MTESTLSSFFFHDFSLASASPNHSHPVMLSACVMVDVDKKSKHLTRAFKKNVAPIGAAVGILL